MVDWNVASTDVMSIVGSIFDPYGNKSVIRSRIARYWQPTRASISERLYRFHPHIQRKQVRSDEKY